MKTLFTLVSCGLIVFGLVSWCLAPALWDLTILVIGVLCGVACIITDDK